METPLPTDMTYVDHKGRLKLPVNFDQWLATQGLVMSIDGDRNLHLRSTVENDQEVDPTGLINSPPNLSSE